MKPSVKSCIFPVLLFATAFAAAQHQVPPGAPAGQHPPFKQGGLEKWQDQDIREVVEMVMMVRLSKELALDDEQTVVLVRRFDALKEKWAQARKDRERLLDGLRAAIKDGSDEAAIEQRLAELVDFDVRMQKEKLGILQEAGEGLSVTQKAKLYVFVGEFEERLRTMVRRAREHQSAGQWSKGQAPEKGQPPFPPLPEPGGEVRRGPAKNPAGEDQAPPDRGSKERRVRDGVRQRDAAPAAAAPSGEASQPEDDAQPE